MFHSRADEKRVSRDDFNIADRFSRGRTRDTLESARVASFRNLLLDFLRRANRRGGSVARHRPRGEITGMQCCKIADLFGEKLRDLI